MAPRGRSRRGPDQGTCARTVVALVLVSIVEVQRDCVFGPGGSHAVVAACAAGPHRPLVSARSLRRVSLGSHRLVIILPAPLLLFLLLLLVRPHGVGEFTNERARLGPLAHEAELGRRAGALSSRARLRGPRAGCSQRLGEDGRREVGSQREQGLAALVPRHEVPQRGAGPLGHGEQAPDASCSLLCLGVDAPADALVLREHPLAERGGREERRWWRCGPGRAATLAWGGHSCCCGFCQLLPEAVEPLLSLPRPPVRLHVRHVEARQERDSCEGGEAAEEVEGREEEPPRSREGAPPHPLQS